MMKRRYQIIRTAGQPDWAAAPRAQIDQLLWTPQIRITAYAQLVDLRPRRCCPIRLSGRADDLIASFHHSVSSC